MANFVSNKDATSIIQSLDDNMVKSITIYYDIPNGSSYEPASHSIERRIADNKAYFELTDFFLNHSTMDILWQNAAPFSTFTAQTVNIGKAWKYNMIYVIERPIKFGDGDSLEETLNSSYGSFCIPINTGITTITDPHSNTTYTNENGLFMNTSIQMSTYDRTARTLSTSGKIFARNCDIYGDDLANKVSNVRMWVESGHEGGSFNDEYCIPLYVLGINSPANGYFAFISR